MLYAVIMKCMELLYWKVQRTRLWAHIRYCGRALHNTKSDRPIQAYRVVIHGRPYTSYLLQTIRQMYPHCPTS